MNINQPLIKYVGSKFQLSYSYCPYYPNEKHVRRVFDPFFGAGGMLSTYMDRFPNAEIWVSDISPHTIGVFNHVRDNPDYMSELYATHHDMLARQGQNYYYYVRDLFNQSVSEPSITQSGRFLFLTRTCVNGLVRFNSSGKFNSPIHHTRFGVKPDKMNKVIRDWSKALKAVFIRQMDYREALQNVHSDDFVFFDPPYANSKSMYMGGFDPSYLWDEMKRLSDIRVNWMLSYDGPRNPSAVMPVDYVFKFETGDGSASSFRKAAGNINHKDKLNANSVYLNYQPQITVT